MCLTTSLSLTLSHSLKLTTLPHQQTLYLFVVTFAASLPPLWPPPVLSALPSTDSFSLLHPNSATDTLRSTLSSSLDSLCPLLHDRTAIPPHLRDCLTRCTPIKPRCEHQRGNGDKLTTLTTCSLINLFSPLSLPLFLQPTALFTKLEFNPHFRTPKNSHLFQPH